MQQPLIPFTTATLAGFQSRACPKVLCVLQQLAWSTCELIGVQRSNHVCCLQVDQTPKGWFIVLVQKDPRDDLITDKRTKRHR